MPKKQRFSDENEFFSDLRHDNETTTKADEEIEDIFDMLDTADTDYKFKQRKFKSVTTRKLPGPAGEFEDVFTATQINKTQSTQNTPRSQTRLEQKEFEKKPWKQLLQFLEEEKKVDLLKKYNIHYISQTGGRKKVPFLAVMVFNVISYDINAHVMFIDPTGKLTATVDKEVIRDYPHVLSPGTVLLLQRVSVFQPAPLVFHLPVLLDNVVKVFESEKPPVIVLTQMNNTKKPSPQNKLKGKLPLSTPSRRVIDDDIEEQPKPKTVSRVENVSKSLQPKNNTKKRLVQQKLSSSPAVVRKTTQIAPNNQQNSRSLKSTAQPEKPREGKVSENRNTPSKNSTKDVENASLFTEISLSQDIKMRDDMPLELEDEVPASNDTGVTGNERIEETQLSKLDEQNQSSKPKSEENIEETDFLNDSHDINALDLEDDMEEDKYSMF